MVFPVAVCFSGKYGQCSADFCCMSSWSLCREALTGKLAMSSWSLFTIYFCFHSSLFILLLFLVLSLQVGSAISFLPLPFLLPTRACSRQPLLFLLHQPPRNTIHVNLNIGHRHARIAVILSRTSR